MKYSVIGLMALAGCGGGGLTASVPEPVIIIEEPTPEPTDATFSGGFSMGLSSSTIAGDMSMLVTFDTGVVSGTSSNMLANGTLPIDGGWLIEGTTSEASMSGMLNDNIVNTTLVGTLDDDGVISGNISGNVTSPTNIYPVAGSYVLTEE